MIVRVEPLTSTRALKGPFDYLRPEGFGEVEVGSLLVVPFGRRELLGVVVGIARSSDLAESRLLAPVRALGIALPPELVELGSWIAAEYCSTVPRALRLLLPPSLTRGQLTGRSRNLQARRPAHVRLGAGREASAEPPPPTVEQREALEDLLGAIGEPEPEPRLLQGVTGSGKTEVYLRLAAAALARDRGVIVLVPEIALAPQIMSRFLDRFGAVLERRPVWLFSVGMPGALPARLQRWAMQEEDQIGDRLKPLVRARDHRLFSGAVRKEHLGVPGRARFRVMGGRYGDFRNWSEIEAFADAVVHALQHPARGATA